MSELIKVSLIKVRWIESELKTDERREENDDKHSKSDVNPLEKIDLLEQLRLRLNLQWT